MLSSIDEKTKAKARIPTMKWVVRKVAVGLLSIAGFVQAQDTSQQVLRPELQKQFRFAQDAFAAKQYQQALRTANEVLSNTALTDYERLVGLRVRAAIANEMQDWDQAILSLEAAVGSNAVDESQKKALLESLLSAIQKKNDAPRLVKWSRDDHFFGGDRPLLINHCRSDAYSDRPLPA